MVKITDLSSTLKNFSMDALEVKIRHISHAENLRKRAAAKGAGLDQVAFAGADDYIFARTHAGSHVDAPWHFGPIVEGKRPKKIDEVPLEWCYGNGVLLDFSKSKKPGEEIRVDDLKDELQRIKYNLQARDIVAIRTGAEDHGDDPKFEEMASGLNKQSLLWLLDQGIRMIGTDSYTLDIPIPRMVEKLRGGNPNAFFPVHYGGREREYIHAEKLYNLKSLQRPFGFKIAIFPIKIEGASGSWTRPVAIEGGESVTKATDLLDLSVPIMAHAVDRNDTQIEYFTHREGARRLAKRFGLHLGLLPDPYLWATEDVLCSSQAGTHVKSPWHFGPGGENAPAKTIDQVPLEALYGDAVLLDFSQKKAADTIRAIDLKKKLDRIGYALKEGDIVLIRTGAEDYIFNDPNYYRLAPSLSGEGLGWLLDQGITTLGSDTLLGEEKTAAETPTSSKRMKGKDASIPTLLRGREICCVEKLGNLKKLPRPFGFKVALFPIKLDNCSAGWTRAVAFL